MLRPNNKVAFVVYAGSSDLVLPSIAGNDKVRIKDALNALSAGGSTTGGTKSARIMAEDLLSSTKK